MTYTIENGTNRIEAHASTKTAKAVAAAERFGSEAELGKLAAHWPGARLIQIWNTLPEAVPVKKFTDRKTAVSRIWNAVSASKSLKAGEQPEAEANREPSQPQQPSATATHEGAQAPDVAAEPAPAITKPIRAKKPTRAADEAKRSHPGSKTAQVLDLLKSQGGATLQQIMDATGWQAHSVRGFISGTLGKKMGLTVESVKGENGIRRYSIQS